MLRINIHATQVFYSKKKEKNYSNVIIVMYSLILWAASFEFTLCKIHVSIQVSKRP